MTVYTRIGRRSGVSVRFWTLLFLAPFWVLWLMVVGTFAVLRLSWVGLCALWYLGVSLAGRIPARDV